MLRDDIKPWSGLEVDIYGNLFQVGSCGRGNVAIALSVIIN